jgi:hypothetical protein
VPVQSTPILTTYFLRFHLILFVRLLLGLPNGTLLEFSSPKLCIYILFLPFHCPTMPGALLLHLWIASRVSLGPFTCRDGWMGGGGLTAVASVDRGWRWRWSVGRVHPKRTHKSVLSGADVLLQGGLISRTRYKHEQISMSVEKYQHGDSANLCGHVFKQT